MTASSCVWWTGGGRSTASSSLLENLVGRSFEALAAGLPDLPLCLDTGHLLLNGDGIGDFLDRHGPRVGEIHLHGVQAGWTTGPSAARNHGSWRWRPF